jgi:flagella basal body P-ring formation protein FlgA
MRPLLHSVASALALLLVAAAHAPAQDADASDGPSAQVRGLVTERVAERWGVEADRLVLEFGTAPESGFPEAVALELLGSGGGGHWIASLTDADGESSSVRVRAGVEIPVLVAARALSRGQELADLDIDRVVEVRWGAPSAPDPEAEAGWVVQRMLRAGEPLRAPAVQPPLAVRSGRSVDLVWQSPGVGIRVRGRALGSAPVGGEVFVRTENGERLRGIVLAPGVVDVTRGGTDG